MFQLGSDYRIYVSSCWRSRALALFVGFLPAFWRSPGPGFLRHWQETSGVKFSKDEGDKETPFEKEQFILDKINNFGWARSKASEKWNEHLAENWDRDNKGEDGAIRLSHPFMPGVEVGIQHYLCSLELKLNFLAN